MDVQPEISSSKGFQNIIGRIRNINLKKLGLYGFLFFLIKGLLWLIVPAAIIYFGFGTD